MPGQHKPILECEFARPRVKRTKTKPANGLNDPVRYSYGIAGADGSDQPAILTPKIIMADQIEAREREWLWRHKLVMGGISMLCGMPDMGKSLISTDIITRVTCGSKWPDCDERAPLGGVVVLADEDDPQTTIKPRLVAAGADCSKVALLRGVKYDDPDDSRDRLVQLDTDIKLLEQAIKQTPDCRLVVIDPISSYMGSADDHKNAAVRGVLAKLSDLAAALRVCVLMISHLRKGFDNHSANRVLGSMAFVAVARAVWMTAWHTVQGDDGKPRKRRVLVTCKNNLTEKRSGLEYVISSKHSSNGEPLVEWIEQPVDLTADDVLAQQGEKTRQSGPEPKEKNKAADFLREALANGPRLVAELTEAAAAVGIKKHTLDRAKAELRIEAYQDSVPGPWLWILPHPQVATLLPDTQEPGNLGNLDESPTDDDGFDLPESQDCQVDEPGEEPGHLPESQDCQDCQVVEDNDVEDVNRLLQESAADME